jgi:siderophore synthetase component
MNGDHDVSSDDWRLLRAGCGLLGPGGGPGWRVVSASLRQVAEQATFQSFANCYLREIDAGVFVRHGDAACVECVLQTQQAALRIERLSTSLCGPHRLGRSFLKRGFEGGWRLIEPFAALQALLQEAYRRCSADDARVDDLRGCELELLARVLDSYQQTESYLKAPRPAPADEDSFIAAEQSLAFGHWLHPTPKSRQGMTTWQQPAYAPELRGAFRLTYFAADSDLVRHASAASQSAPEIVAALTGADAERFRLRRGETLIPMHPLQADALMLDPDVQALTAQGGLRALGPAGAPFTATSSVRTVWSADAAWMLKFSIPVRITNSVRLNRRHELEAGVAVARLFERTDFFVRHPRFRVIADPAYLTLDLPGRSESGFETIFRENPYRGDAARGVATIAALTAEPRPGEASRLERIVRDVAAREGRGVGDVCDRWFCAYLDCALEPLIRLYDELGVALEAHQQNSLLDVRSGYPCAYHYRDSQGFYLSNRYRSSLLRLAPETERIGHLYFDDAEIQGRFAYYLIVNQVFSVVSRMGHDGLADERDLLERLRERLERLARTLNGAGRDFALSALNRPTISAKANLVTRLYGVDELASDGGAAMYSRFPNPLHDLSRGGVRAVAG